MKRSLIILALVSLFWWTVPHGAFGQAIVCSNYDNKSDCETNVYCSWCDSTQQCIPSDWPSTLCPACEDVSYYNCGIIYTGCKRCPLTYTCADMDKPCYCGNGELNSGEECDGTPYCDSIMCTCDEGYIKDPNHPPYCCWDGCTCNGIASTESNVCSGHGVCMGTDDCLCFEGWTGSDCAAVENQPPSVDAGENIAIRTEEIAITIIQGTAADEDPDDVLEYQWKEGETVLLDWTAVGENGECPLDLSTIPLEVGTHTLILEVTDGETPSSDEMVLTLNNSAPHAASEGCGIYEVNTEVTLGGQVSDFDGDLLVYQWMEGVDVLDFDSIQALPGGTPVNLPSYTTSNLSLGSHTIILQVEDGINEPVSADCLITIQDTGNPTLSPDVNTNILWPPNHKMVDITIEANASDDSGLPVTLTAEVTSNEPENGLGDGDRSPDWTEPLIDQDNGIITLQLRAERSGSGNGRVYTISVTATDESENSSQAQVEIIVPHDKRKK